MSDITVTVQDGVTVDVTVAGGSSVTVDAPASSSIEVTNKGPKGDTGATGPQGPTGAGVAAGGTENQVLQKNSGVDYDTKWSAYRLPGADGSNGQALITNGSGTVFFGNPSSSESSDKIELPVRFDEAVSKGDPLYITGYNNGQNRITVAKADASDSSKMPSIGLASADYSQNDNGECICIGSLEDVDTQVANDFQEGDVVYVASGGGLTNVKPTGTNLIQNVGKVGRRQQNNGEIVVMAIGRSNDVPNIPDGQIWIGNASGVATPTDFAVALDSTPQLGGDLDVNGNKIVSAGGGDIRIEPTTTGDVIVRPVTGEISLQCQTGVELDGKSFPASIKFLEADTQSPRHTIAFYAPNTWDSNLIFTLPSTTGSDGQVLKTNGGGVLSFVDKMDDVSDDTTPQLGGDLDVNGNKITSASNGDITIDPDGTGAIILKSDDIQFDGAGTFQGKIKLYESDIAGSNFIALQAPLMLASDVTYTLPTAGSSGQFLKTDASGVLSWGDVLPKQSATHEGTLSIKKLAGNTDGQIAFFDDDGDNFVILKAADALTTDTTFILPTADGSAGQFLRTDGSGNLAFSTPPDTNTNLGNSDLTISANRTVDMNGSFIDFQDSSATKFKIFNTGTAQGTGRFTVAGNGTAAGMLRLGDASGATNMIALQHPDSGGGYTLKLPTADGSSGQVLQTDGSGNLSFATVSGGGGNTFTQVYNMNFFDDLSTLKHFIPWKDINEQTFNYQDESALLCPFDGKVKSVSVKYTALTASGNITIGLETCPTGVSPFTSGNWTVEETEVLAATSTDDNHTFHFVFDNAQHFEAGDMLAISIQHSADITGNTYVHATAVVEFDTSTDLGSSSTEHESNP